MNIVFEEISAFLSKIVDETEFIAYFCPAKGHEVG